MVSTLSSLTFSLGVGVNFNPRLRRLISACVRLYEEMFIIFGSTGLVSFSRGLCLLFLLKNGCDLLIRVVLFAVSVDVDEDGAQQNRSNERTSTMAQENFNAAR